MNYCSAVFLILWLPCTNTFNIGLVSAYNTLIRRSLATSLVQGWKYLSRSTHKARESPPRLHENWLPPDASTLCIGMDWTSGYQGVRKQEWFVSPATFSRTATAQRSEQPCYWRLSLEAQQATGPTRNSVWIRQVTRCCCFCLACSNRTGSYSLR